MKKLFFSSTLIIHILLTTSCGHQKIENTHANRQVANVDDVDQAEAKQNDCKKILLKFANLKLSPDEINPTLLNNLDAKASQLSFTPLIPLKNREILSIENLLKTGKIVEIVLHGVNSNSTYLLTFSNGTTAIWKPHELRWSSNYRTEVLNYEFDRKFRFNLVPPTVERTIDNQKGSVQLFKLSGKKYFDESKELHEKYLSGLKKMFLFDFLTDQRDRSSDNYLASPTADVIAIDNGMSFTGQGYNEFSTWEFRKEFITDFLQTDEGKRIISELQHLDRNDFRIEVERYIGKKDTDRLFERIDFIIKYFHQIGKK